MCTDCPLYKTSPNTLWGSGNTPCNVMVVTDMPTTYEATKLQASNANKWFVRELNNVGIDLADCYFTYALKCNTLKKGKTELKACRHNLLKEIETVKPKVILALGSDALYSLTGKTTITKLRGEILYKDDIKILPTFHPNAILRAPEQVTVFRADLYYFKRLIDNDWDDLTGFNWRIVTSRQDRYDFYRKVYQSTCTAYDIETTELKNTDNGLLLMMGVATDEEVFLFPWEHPKVRRPDGFPEEQIQWYFDEAPQTTGQNTKFDNRWLRSRGIRTRTDFDTYLAHYAWNNTLPHGLKYNAKVEFGATNYDAGIEFNVDFPFKIMAKYCALDCYYTRRWVPLLQARLQGVS